MTEHDDYRKLIEAAANRGAPQGANRAAPQGTASQAATIYAAAEKAAADGEVIDLIPLPTTHQRWLPKTKHTVLAAAAVTLLVLATTLTVHLASDAGEQTLDVVEPPPTQPTPEAEPAGPPDAIPWSGPSTTAPTTTTTTTEPPPPPTEPPPTTVPMPTPPPYAAPPGTIGDLLLICDSRAPFPRSALDNPLGAENDDDAAAAALRDLMGDGSFMIRATTWRRLYDDGDTVAFGSGPQTTPGEEGTRMEHVTFTRSGDEFSFQNSQSSCRPRPVLDGYNHVSFQIAPDADLHPGTTAVKVLVNESGCPDDAHPLETRLTAPIIEHGNGTVDVLFAAVPAPSSGEVFACPAVPVPPTEALLELREPLGGRLLRDASSFPPRDATTSYPGAMPL